MPSTDHLSYRERLQLRARRPLDNRVRHVVLNSKILGTRKSFYVALPPGYGSVANRNRRYPALYLFRGHEHEWVHRWQDRSRRGRTAIDVYRELLEEGEVGPLILVFPGISSDDNRIPGMLVNFKNPTLAAKAPGIGSGRFEDYFIQELIPLVEQRYRAIGDRKGRAVDGFSLGGFQAIKIAAQYPELFSSAGSFDGTFLFATNKGKAVRGTDRVVRNPMFAPAFDRPADLTFVAANNPSNLIWNGDRSKLADVQWMVRSGPESAEPWQSNYYRAQHLIKILKSRKLPNEVPSVLKGARHSWHWADTHLRGTLPLHWQVLRDANGCSPHK
jgi:esterase/lipase superfamily enzyme